MNTKIPKRSDGRLLRWSSLGGPNPGMPVVVSYYTDLFYMRDAFELARTCQLFGLDYVIEQVGDKDDWQRNTRHKPTFLLEKHKDFPERSLLWLDADARVRAFPEELLVVSESIAYHLHKKKLPLSGTVLLAPGHLREAFLRQWLHAQERYKSENDQSCMGRALGCMNKAFTFFDLPARYCWIYDYNGEGPVGELHVDYKPVFEHMQSSRWAKYLSKKP